MDRLLCIRSFPRAILHVDGDAFFASCEQVIDKSLRGKPVVTGVERGIASSLSYEAKARGVTRGMPLHEIRRVCPECVLLPSDYETYSLFSLRMYDVVRRYTSVVEEYSIDECFADLTGLRRSLKMSYREIAVAIKRDLDRELGVSFSVGLAPTKVVAKVASSWNKPSGLEVISGKEIHHYLGDLPVEKLWGIGKNTSAFLQRHGVMTARDFAYKKQAWVEENLAKPYQEIWHELHGTSLLRVDPEKKQAYKSISKTRTFTPPSKDRSFVFSQLSKNVENACIKARRYNLATPRVSFFLKTQDFRFHSAEITLSNAVSLPGKIIDALEKPFERVYREAVLYRGTGVFLHDLVPRGLQSDLFGEYADVEKMETIHKSVDEVNSKYGKHTVFLGSSFEAHKKGLHENDRGMSPERVRNLLPGETVRKRLAIPIIGEVM